MFSRDFAIAPIEAIDEPRRITLYSHTGELPGQWFDPAPGGEHWDIQIMDDSGRMFPTYLVEDENGNMMSVDMALSEIILLGAGSTRLV